MWVMEDSGIDSGDHNGDTNPKVNQNGERIFTVRILNLTKKSSIVCMM